MLRVSSSSGNNNLNEILCSAPDGNVRINNTNVSHMTSGTCSPVAFLGNGSNGPETNLDGDDVSHISSPLGLGSMSNLVPSGSHHHLLPHNSGSGGVPVGYTTNGTTTPTPTPPQAITINTATGTTGFLPMSNNGQSVGCSTTTHSTNQTHHHHHQQSTPGLISLTNSGSSVMSRTTTGGCGTRIHADPQALMTTTSNNNNGNPIESKHHHSSNNGIFLVDGLGRGLRIDNRMQQHQQYDQPPSVHQYGLPPVPHQSGITTNSPRSCQLQERTLDMTCPPSCSTSTNIRIEGTNTTTPTHALSHHHPIENQNQFQNNNIGNSQQNFRPGGTTSSSPVIIPISTIPSPTGQPPPITVPSVSNNVPKCKKNCVTLPVPSPPALSMISIPYAHEQSSSAGFESLTGNTPLMPISMSSRIIPTHQNNPSSSTERMLISTEAQTEDMPPLTNHALAPPPPIRNREQRKRERRERRRDRHPSFYRSPGPSRSTTHGEFNIRGNEPIRNVDICEGQGQLNGGNINITGERNLGPNSQQIRTHGEIGLPDLLNLPPPPYSTLPPQNCDPRRNGVISPNGNIVPLAIATTNISPTNFPQQLTNGGHITAPPPLLLPPPQSCAVAHTSMAQPPNCLSSPQPIRYHFSPPAPPMTRASRRSLRTPRGIPYASEEEPKSCCGMSTSQAVSIRWFIIVIAGIGICCTVAGTALGAARSAGSQHLTLSLLMIGVGVVLLTVSAVAWRLTANESGTSSCRAMLGFSRNGVTRGDGGSEPNRVFVPRLPPSYGRPHHPYAAMMYPDFQYRPPPPSYQASMQEYRLRLLLLERSNPNMTHGAIGNPNALTLVNPPPAYRPYNAAILLLEMGQIVVKIWIVIDLLVTVVEVQVV